MRRYFFVGSVLAGLCYPGLSSAASFDCSKATTSDEKLVCANPKLSDIDTLLGDAYTKARFKANPDYVRSIAKGFMMSRKACTGDISCIVTLYVATLQTYNSFVGSGELPRWLLDYNSEVTAAPIEVGKCAVTYVSEVAPRLIPDGPAKPQDFDTGTYIGYTNGTGQVSYDKELFVIKSRRGDKVLQCLQELPTDCPPGDLRGKVYKVTNLRTNASWTLADSQHLCGGA